MKIAAVAGCLLLFATVAAASPETPSGWFRAGSHPGDYDMGSDRAAAHSGKAGAYLRSKSSEATGFGTLMQVCKAGPFHGKRVRMSGWAKSEDVTSWAGLWMRVDGTDQSHMLAFDNMQGRPIKGTSGWTRYEIVLDVAPEAGDIAFGILLNWTGTVWLDDVKFEVVDKSVATTGSRLPEEFADNPMNLDFEE